jgi:aryl-alcohol dehydrogenase-like predicted oxidoreductase
MPISPTATTGGNHPRFLEGNLEANLKLVAAVEAVARERDATAAQIALAWLIAQAPEIVPIPRAKRSRISTTISARPRSGWARTRFGT